MPTNVNRATKVQDSSKALPLDLQLSLNCIESIIDSLVVELLGQTTNSTLADTESSSNSNNKVKTYAASVKSNANNVNPPVSLPAQTILGIKLIVNVAVNQAFRSKVINGKGRSSFVVYGLRENHKDISNAKDLLDATNYSYCISKICHLEKLLKLTNIPAQTTIPCRPLLVGLQSCIEQQAILHAANILKDTQFNNVFIRK